MNRILSATIGLISCLALFGCTASQQTFYADSGRVSDTSLCRTYSETDDPAYKADVKNELNQRAISDRECDQLILAQNIAIGVTAAVAVGVTAAAICSNTRCPTGGGGGSGQYADWDQFYDEFFRLVWRCREIATGRFTEDEYCALYPKVDDRWPHKRQEV